MKDGNVYGALWHIDNPQRISGEAPELQDWFLEYVFERRRHDGDWSFLPITEHTMWKEVLPLKTDFDPLRYSLE
jgi:hypothetical protein